MSTIDMTLAELKLFIETMPEDTVLSVDFSGLEAESAEQATVFDGESPVVKAGE